MSKYTKEELLLASPSLRYVSVLRRNAPRRLTRLALCLQVLMKSIFYRRWKQRWI